MILHGRNGQRLLSKENIVPIPPNDMTESAKRKPRHAFEEVVAHKKGCGLEEIFIPRPVSPRKVTSGCPKESQISRDPTLKK